MNGDINDMLKSVLQNPEALSGVMKLAQGMMNSKDINTDNRSDNAEFKRDNANSQENIETMRRALPNLPSSFAYDEDRVRLLKALRPYLGEKRRKKIDNIISMMTLLKMFSEKAIQTPAARAFHEPFSKDLPPNFSKMDPHRCKSRHQPIMILNLYTLLY